MLNCTADFVTELSKSESLLPPFLNPVLIQEFSLELADAVTIHILESSSAKYDAVKELMESGRAFETIVDGEGSGMSLSPLFGQDH